MSLQIREPIRKEQGSIPDMLVPCSHLEGTYPAQERALTACGLARSHEGGGHSTQGAYVQPPMPHSYPSVLLCVVSLTVIWVSDGLVRQAPLCSDVPADCCLEVTLALGNHSSRPHSRMFLARHSGWGA